MSANMRSLKSHRTAGLILLVVGLTLPAGAASAQSILDPRPGSGSGRYQMQPVDGGIARLDTRTGTIVLCRTAGDGIACDAAAARRDGGTDAGAQGDASDDSLSTGPQSSQDLTDRVAALERKVAELESGRATVSDEAAADAAIDRARKLFRGFAGIMRDFDRDMRQDRGGDDAERGDGSGSKAPSDRGQRGEGSSMPGRT